MTNLFKANLVSERTIAALAEAITGGSASGSTVSVGIYRSAAALRQFFAEAHVDFDVVSQSRVEAVRDKLKQLNRAPESHDYLCRLFHAAVDPQHFLDISERNPERQAKTLDYLNKRLTYDGLTLQRYGRGHRLIRTSTNLPASRELTQHNQSELTRRYYSSRKSPKGLTVETLYWKLQNLFLLFRGRDFFKQKAGITETSLPDVVIHRAAVALTFQPFPLTKWKPDQVTEDHIFDALEFLHDLVSKPGELVQMRTDSGFEYSDYEGYDEEAGQVEFRNSVNAFLSEYKNGFELTTDGFILAKGTDGLQHILDAEIVAYDERNVDSKVRDAITKWRNRHLSLSEKREAIRELADVFEWLKKTKKLESALDAKDESAIFEIANNFAIRHHNPKQKANYDAGIWYAWIFHFYLATYHAVIRLLIKKDRNVGSAVQSRKEPAKPHQ